jgi:HTH-type transcriptional regulator/antitoxin HigA
MKTKKIENRQEYDEVMAKIEVILNKSTQNGGSESLSKKELDTLEALSLMAEEYEDSIPLMPIKKPTTLKEMIRFKMFELNIKQKQLAKMLDISESRISELLNGKTKLNIKLAKKLHKELDIDADFLLDVA